MRPHPQTEFPSRGKLRFPYPGRFGRSIRAVIGRIPGHRTSNSTSFPPESPTPPTPIPLQANPVRALAEPIVNGPNTLSVDAGHEQSPARNLPACVSDTASRPELRTLQLTRAGTIRLSRHCAADGNSAHSRPDTPDCSGRNPGDMCLHRGFEIFQRNYLFITEIYPTFAPAIRRRSLIE